ncbi:hypothetical protein ACCS79_03595 [Rhizobium johnstonii]|uniref:hypothetical protein n=1 Tax=Rhizobium johnstonii TaxID=3019933 RepID=UPI003F992F7A
MSIENHGTIITPTARSANADSFPMFPLDTTRVFKLELTGGGDAVDHELGDDTEGVLIFVDIDSDDRLPVVEVLRGSGETWPLVSGYHYPAVVKNIRTLTFSLPGSGTAVVKIQEA